MLTFVPLAPKKKRKGGGRCSGEADDEKEKTLEGRKEVVALRK